MVMSLAMAALPRATWRVLNGVVVCALLCSTAFVPQIAHGLGTDVNAATGAPPNAIFVFGDSYLDTGNHNKSAVFNRPWLAPYGVTYPGTPAGRFSDGRVFADVFANALQMLSPIAYELRFSDPNAPKHGMNFAVGGSGVFNPYGMLNLGGQIDQLESLIDIVYPKAFLQYSVVLVGVHGNDYGAYLAKGNPVSGIPVFQRLVVGEMVYQLERLNKLGFKTFYINNIQPIGCLPSSTRPEFNECSEDTDAIMSVGHNDLLVAAVANLTQRLPEATFRILDLYSAFTAVLRDPAKYGISTEPLMPCCLGAGNATRSCGEFGRHGKPMFTVCKDPAKSFFWDTNHPSQAGWIAVAKVLFPDADLEPLSSTQHRQG
ncbi:hypothetical protein M758_6G196000 [Ceratodon purpureus]|nr:hypothetical protein M758_6G196000 [Ceratodon purpureus]